MCKSLILDFLPLSFISVRTRFCFISLLRISCANAVVIVFPLSNSSYDPQLLRFMNVHMPNTEMGAISITSEQNQPKCIKDLNVEPEML